MSDTRKKISSRSFYEEYHGHKVRHLKELLPRLREASDLLIWTAGDSSLDNKYWYVSSLNSFCLVGHLSNVSFRFNDQRPSIGAYRDILEPPISKCDVTYWLNYLAQSRAGEHIAAINAAGNKTHYGVYSLCVSHPEFFNIYLIAILACYFVGYFLVEATTLNERTFSLWPQDRFIRDNIRSNDILIVSVGGNDVALCPTPCTIVSILCLLSLPFKCIENGISIGAVPVRSTPSDEFLETQQFLIMCFCAAQCNDCCCGCGPSLLSCAGTCPPCLGYFRHLFGTRYVLQKRVAVNILSLHLSLMLAYISLVCKSILRH